eukprot:15469251-Alexandrium_andersonii.AAC.1
MLVKSLQLGLSRCAGRANMGESVRGRGRAPSTEAHWGPLRAAPQTAAVLRAKTLLHSNLRRREAAPQVALSECSRP